jgi:osmotically-inducible protein OsmY
VILSGLVRSWAEKQAVAAAARGTHGVRAVDDKLQIEPYV